jgi:outer membrane protein assembly factor BamD
MFRSKGAIVAGLLLISAFLGLGLSSCSRQHLADRMDPNDRLALADRLRNEGKCLQAVQQYEKLLSEFPTPQVSELARFNLAVCHLDLKQYDLARTELEDFIDSYPRSDLVDNALYTVALSYLRAAPRPERDQTNTVKAMDELLVLLREYPDTDVRAEADASLAECRSRLAEKEYLAGELYFKMRDYNAAVIYLDSVVDTYGDTLWAPRALFLKGKALAAQRRYDEAKAAFRRVTDDFPGSDVGAAAAGALKELENGQAAKEETGSGG